MDPYGGNEPSPVNRFVRNPKEPSERLVELEDQKDHARHCEGAKRERAKAGGIEAGSHSEPKNSSVAQDTTITISGQEIGLANCSDMRSRVCWKIAELALMNEPSAVCAGERGLSEDSVSFHFSNLDM